MNRINNKFIEYKIFFSITELCKANCKYCDFPKYQKRAKTVTVQNLDIIFDVVKKQIKETPEKFKKFAFYVEGGEIGEVPKDILDYFFINSGINQFNLFTNGVFFEKGYFEIYKKYFNEISFHMTVEHSIDKSLELIRKYKEVLKEVLIVITENNSETVYDIIKNNPDILFKFQRQINRKGSKYFTKNTYVKTLEKIFILQNVSGNLEEVDAVKNDKHIDIKRKMCANNYNRIFIDASNLRLYRCQGTRTVSFIDFDKTNFQKMIINEDPVFKDLMDETCKTCEHIKMHNMKPFNVKTSSKIFKKMNHYE